jgi:predicted nucleotidyltransferase component of viral defense system
VIHPNLLKRQADQDRLTAGPVERDYVLTHVLAAIAVRDVQAQIVFKGGTALSLDPPFWRVVLSVLGGEMTS